MATREDLVAVGVRLLERDGLGSLTLRRIAAAAGVSHGAPRHYFPTYGSLLAAVARAGVAGLDAALSEAFARADPLQRIEEAATAYVGFAVARPEMFELISRHDLLAGQGGELRTVTAGWFERLADAVAKTQGAPDVTRATALWSGVHGVAVLFSRRTVEPVDAELEVSRVLSVLVDSLLVPASQGAATDSRPVSAGEGAG